MVAGTKTSNRVMRACEDGKKEGRGEEEGEG